MSFDVVGHGLHVSFFFFLNYGVSTTSVMSANHIHASEEKRKKNIAVYG